MQLLDLVNMRDFWRSRLDAAATDADRIRARRELALVRREIARWNSVLEVRTSWRE